MTDDSKARVLAFLERAAQKVSEGDVAAGAGIDVATAKRELYSLMLAYTCSLQVREDGTLVYDFGQKLVSLHAQTWRDHLRTGLRWAWRGFSWLYKASLAVILVTYTIAFVVLIIAVAIAASAASKDEGPAEGAFRLVGAIFRGIFEFTTHSAVIYSQEDRHGYRHRHYEPTRPVMPLRQPKEHAKSFTASVYDFVLGPDRVAVDARAQHRELASFVRESGGALSIADVQALSGLSRTQAEQLFARFVAEFEGTAEIAEDGALVANFDELQRSSSTDHDEPIVYYWDEYEPPFEVTGNSVGKNIAIAALAAFNLICSVAVAIELGGQSSFLVWLGYVPTAIFTLFFTIPAARSLWIWRQNQLQHAHNIRKRLFGAVFKDARPTLTVQDVVATANRVAGSEERLDANASRPLFEEAMADMGGDVHLAPDGELCVDLGILRNEVAARQASARQRPMAAIAYSTDE